MEDMFVDTQEFPVWWETSVVGSGITEDMVNESLTEVMAALDILKRIGLKPRVTVVAPGDSEDEYVMYVMSADTRTFRLVGADLLSTC